MNNPNQKSVLRRGSAKENRACDNCRRRKIRCYAKDSGTGCQFCTRMHFKCTYNDPVLKRGPKSSLASRFGHFNDHHSNESYLKQENCDYSQQKLYPNIDMISYQNPNTDFIQKLTKLAEVLRLRAHELHIHTESISYVVDFFTSFGPNHPMITIDMLLKLVHIPELPPTLPFLLHSMIYHYLAHHPDTSVIQLEHFYQTARSFFPQPVDLHQKLLYASMNLLDRSQLKITHSIHRPQLPPLTIPVSTHVDSLLTSGTFPKISSSPLTPTYGFQLPPINTLLLPTSPYQN